MESEVHIFDGMPHGYIHNMCEEKKRAWNKQVSSNKPAKMSWETYNKRHVNFAEHDQWIHLSDAFEKGTISPLEALDALELGFVPEALKTRDSRYSQLL